MLFRSLQNLVEQIYQNLHAKLANLNCSLDLAVFQKIKTGGKALWPLIWRSTVHSLRLPHDGSREGREDAAAETHHGAAGRRRRLRRAAEEVVGVPGMVQATLGMV